MPKCSKAHLLASLIPPPKKFSGGYTPRRPLKREGRGKGCVMAVGVMDAPGPRPTVSLLIDGPEQVLQR